MNKKLLFLCEAGIIAAIYAALTLAFAPISYGMVQFRVSEALCVLPFFTPSAVPGLFIGCLISNIFGGNGLLDVIVGSLATLLAAYATYKIKSKWLAPLPAVIINALAVGAMLHFVINIPLLESMAYIFIGQAGACYLVGMPLLFVLNKYSKHIFLIKRGIKK